MAPENRRSNDHESTEKIGLVGILPKRYALPLLALIAGLTGYGGGQILPAEPDAVSLAAYKQVRAYARLAEERNAEWEACWKAFGQVQPMDHAGCPPAYVSATSSFGQGSVK